MNANTNTNATRKHTYVVYDCIPENCYHFARIACLKIAARVIPNDKTRQCLLYSAANYANALSVYDTLGRVTHVKRVDKHGDTVYRNGRPVIDTYIDGEKASETPLISRAAELAGGYTDGQDLLQNIAITCLEYLSNGINPLTRRDFWVVCYRYAYNRKFTTIRQKREIYGMTADDIACALDVDSVSTTDFIAALRLTPREKKIVALRAQKATQAEIAAECDMTVAAVANACKRIQARAAVAYESATAKPPCVPTITYSAEKRAAKGFMVDGVKYSSIRAMCAAHSDISRGTVYRLITQAQQNMCVINGHKIERII